MGNIKEFFNDLGTNAIFINTIKKIIYIQYVLIPVFAFIIPSAGFFISNIFVLVVLTILYRILRKRVNAAVE
jgi:hypothetical protein